MATNEELCKQVKGSKIESAKQAGKQANQYLLFDGPQTAGRHGSGSHRSGRKTEMNVLPEIKQI